MTTLHQTFELLGIDVAHYFGGGVYIKATAVPANRRLTQHIHKHDHLSVLVSGRALVTADGISKNYHAPAILEIKAGIPHEVEAQSDILWLCIHATDETNIEKVDAELVA